MALVALKALEALALMFSSTLGLISLALALLFSSAQDWQARELILVGQVVALEALVTLVPMLSSTLGFISLALTLVLSSAQTCQAPELMLLGQAVALKAAIFELTVARSLRTAYSPKPSSTRRCRLHRSSSQFLDSLFSATTFSTSIRRS